GICGPPALSGVLYFGHIQPPLVVEGALHRAPIWDEVRAVAQRHRNSVLHTASALGVELLA
ncbi:hypothetical protein, partial [Lentzea sp. NPDC004782]|uniref:hypothetical protein n=1 Tax=Lentzea sp. NPDC004782 TaxID=3154458 RepID=UPI0033A61138